MNSISECIDSLIAIDDQVFLAECDVMLANDIWLNKMSDMIKYSGNSDSMIGYIQEADYGRRDTGGNQWLSKLRIFILKCIDKIVDAVTNFLLKIKTRKADYIRIPYKYEDLMEDINLVKSIDKEIYQIFDNVENFASVDNVHKLTAIKEKLRNTHFAKNQRFMISDKDPEAHNKLNKYGIKPDQYMKLAKELRDLNRALNDTKTRASKMVRKEWLKDPNSIDKPRVVVQELLFNIYTEMSKMMVKLMQSFTVSGVEKMSAEKIAKKVDQLKKDVKGFITIQYVSESNTCEFDEDLEYFDETEKPFNDWLKQHDYDPETNTIAVYSRRKNGYVRQDIGIKKPSKKELNRINRFLRENNYDPKTETYESDLPTGKKRILLTLTKDDTSASDLLPLVNMSIKDTKQKPHESNQTLKHEEGHVAQLRRNRNLTLKDPYAEDNKGIDKSSTVAGDSDEINAFIKDNPLNHKHYTGMELDADLYGYQHNRYATKDHKILGHDKNEIMQNKDAKKLYNSIEEDERRKRDSAIEHAKTFTDEEIKYFTNKINETSSHLTELNNELKKAESETKQISGDFDFPDYNVTHISNKIDDAKKELQDMKDILQDLKNTDRKKEIDEATKKAIDEYNKTMEAVRKNIYQIVEEIDLRNKFIHQHADEAGSKARKLEGRQGKHKGKK